MRRLYGAVILIAGMLAGPLPALAQEGDPLAESVLLPNVVGWGLVGLAVVLMVLFVLWSRRSPG
jgi:hypothetical protein